MSEEELKRVFEGGESASYAMIIYARDVRGLSYAPSNYTEETVGAISEYVKSVEELISGLRERWNIEFLDSSRAACHNRAAQELVSSGIVSTTKLGRAMCRLILIDKGYDTYESAGASDIERIRRRFGIR